MKKIGFIALIAVIFFFFEFALFQFLGKWFNPNLLILLVLFFTLYTGIRYGIAAAVFAGFIKDSFSLGLFGLSIFTFIMCAYLAVLIKKYLHQGHSGAGDIFFSFIISILNILITFGVLSVFHTINFYDMVMNVMLPEVIATTFISYFVFDGLKRCVLKSSVL